MFELIDPNSVVLSVIFLGCQHKILTGSLNVLNLAFHCIMQILTDYEMVIEHFLRISHVCDSQ